MGGARASGFCSRSPGSWSALSSVVFPDAYSEEQHHDVVQEIGGEETLPNPPPSGATGERIRRRLPADAVLRRDCPIPPPCVRGGLRGGEFPETRTDYPIPHPTRAPGRRSRAGRVRAPDTPAPGMQVQVQVSAGVLVVSGRQSFEIVQKAAVVGIGGIVGVSAPSSLAVELAEELGLLLVGFSRGEVFNVYAGEDHLGD